MRREIRKIVYTAMYLALGILLPYAFHTIPNAGQIFLPMHIPALLAGFMLGPIHGLFVGVMSPVLSCFITGMPLLQVMPGMAFEIGLYGLFSGLFYRLIKTRNETVDLFLTLFLALLLGKAARGIYDTLLYFSREDLFTWTAFFTTYFVTAWPGLLIQILVIPSVLSLLRLLGFLSREDRTFFPERSGKALLRKEAEYFNEKAKNPTFRDKENMDKLQKIISLLPLKESDLLLEVGTGKGELAFLLHENHYKVRAIDLSQGQIALAKKTYPEMEDNFIAEDFYSLKEKDVYDAIILCNSYPHFLDARNFRKVAKEILKKNGFLIIIQDTSQHKINRLLSEKEHIKLARKLSSPSLEALPFLFSFTKVKIQNTVPDSYLLVLKKH